MRARARIFLGTGASPVCTTTDGGRTPIVLDRYDVCADVCGLYLSNGRAFMVNSTGSQGRESWAQRVWLAVKLFAEYVAETLIGVGLFVVLVFASRLTRWICEDTVRKTPEIAWVPKSIELLLLVSGAFLCALFIVRITLQFAQALVPRQAAWLRGVFLPTPPQAMKEERGEIR